MGVIIGSVPVSDAYSSNEADGRFFSLVDAGEISGRFEVVDAGGGDLLDVGGAFRSEIAARSAGGNSAVFGSTQKKDEPSFNSVSEAYASIGDVTLFSAKGGYSYASPAYGFSPGLDVGTDLLPTEDDPVVFSRVFSDGRVHDVPDGVSAFLVDPETGEPVFAVPSRRDKIAFSSSNVTTWFYFDSHWDDASSSVVVELCANGELPSNADTLVLNEIESHEIDMIGGYDGNSLLELVCRVVEDGSSPAPAKYPSAHFGYNPNRGLRVGQNYDTDSNMALADILSVARYSTAPNSSGTAVSAFDVCANGEISHGKSASNFVSGTVHRNSRRGSVVTGTAVSGVTSLSTNVDSPTRLSYMQLQPGTWLVVAECSVNTGPTTGARNVDTSIWTGTSSTAALSSASARVRRYYPAANWLRQSVFGILTITTPTYVICGAAATITATTSNSAVMWAVCLGN